MRNSTKATVSMLRSTISTVLKKSNALKLIIPFLAFFFLGQSVLGQVSLTGTGSGNSYSQNFNTVAASVPAGWAFSETGTNANTSFSTGTGTASGGDTYFFGTSSEYAFGGLLSGSLTPTIGASFTNNTGGRACYCIQR